MHAPLHHRELRRQTRVSALSGAAVGFGALVLAAMESSDRSFPWSAFVTPLGLFAFAVTVAFVGSWLIERRVADRWLPLVYGFSSWCMLQTVVAVTNHVALVASIGPIMVGILPVAIALFSRWQVRHQLVWCLVSVVPLAITAAIPLGDDIWPVAERLALLQAFAIGAILSVAGIRVLDDARRVVHEQEARVIAARGAELEALDELRRSERRYREIVELSQEGIWVTDNDGCTTLANDRAAEILGYRRGELEGRNIAQVLDPEVVASLAIGLGADHPTEPLADIPARRSDGSRVWLSAAATRLLDDAGTPFGTLAMFNDVSHRHEVEAELRESNRALDRLAYLDGLTGLHNRRALDGAIEEHSTAGHDVGVLMIDIDRFKGYNDTNGHQAGDEALRAVGGALTSALRPDDKVYRYGGEEFLILVERATDRQALIIAERARLAVTKLHLAMRPSDPDSVLTASAGVATGRPSKVGMRALIAAADAALYRAKADGRDRSVLADVGSALPVS